MKELSPLRSRRLGPSQDIQPEFTYVSEPEAVSLSEYWNILVKRRRTILSLFFLLFAVGTYFALSATALYTAIATVKIEPQNPQVTGLTELQPLGLGAGYDYYQTQFALLRSRRLAAKVITELDLESNNGFKNVQVISPNPISHVRSWLAPIFRYVNYFISPLLRSSAQDDSVGNLPGVKSAEIELTVPRPLIDKYLGFVAVVPVLQTRLVQIQFTTPSPNLSQVLANAHVENFMRMSLEDRFSLTKEAREFLDQKKSELRGKLEKSEAAINEFRRAHGVLSVEKGENIVVDRLVDLNKQLTVARAQRIEAESLHRTVENRNHHDLADIMKQGLVQQLKSSMANLEAEKARLGTVFKPEHPRIQELNQQIANARQAFNREINSVVGGIKSSYAAALAKERALQAEAEKQQQDALRLKELGVDYTVLQEDVNSNRLLYESVAKRLNETSVSKDLAVSNMQIAERAAKPLEASAPNVVLYVLASIFSGLLLGVGTALLQEFFDSTVATPDEVWRSVGLGTLGVVPHLKPLNGGNGKTRQIERKIRGREQPFSSSHNREPAKELIISHGPLSIVSESYRTIRASLLLSQAEKPPQVILLTSPSPGEGKTVTSANLAIALAHDGHSVLLVDGDMRRGTCHTRLGLRNGRGLSNVLAGGVALEESIQSTAVSGLSLLPRGVTPPNPSELLGSRKMKEILDDLRQKFEFIVIDSPPVIALSDAAVLSVVSDGVLLVFDGQRTSTAYAQKAVERLETVRARLLGVILNGVNLDDPHYSYYQAYYSYYQMPNGEDPITPAGNETVDWLNGKNKIARNGKAPTNVAENAQSIKAGKRQWEYPLDTGVEHLETPGSVDALRYSTQADSRKSQPASNDFTVVSQEFMNRLLKALLDAVGPVAPLILRDHIALLGESQDAFPKSRVDELVKLIAPEILHAELRSRFQKDISEEMRNMERG